MKFCLRYICESVLPPGVIVRFVVNAAKSAAGGSDNYDVKL